MRTIHLSNLWSSFIFLNRLMLCGRASSALPHIEAQRCGVRGMLFLAPFRMLLTIAPMRAETSLEGETEGGWSSDRLLCSLDPLLLLLLLSLHGMCHFSLSLPITDSPPMEVSRTDTRGSSIG